MVRNIFPVEEANVTALFVSDVHMHASLPATVEAFIRFLQKQAATTKRLYLLGDLFEYWAGDDDLHTPFHQKIITELKKVSSSGVAVFWIAGNRDFLIGQEFADACGLTLLPDPYLAEINGEQIILTHGDALCSDDVDYIAFRKMVRQPEWQQQFLAKSLVERKGIIENLRANSQAEQQKKSTAIMDTNCEAVENLFDRFNVKTMIHGHTHRPALHIYQGEYGTRRRYVLPDWDADMDTASIRGGWLAIDYSGKISRHAISA